MPQLVAVAIGSVLFEFGIILPVLVMDIISAGVVIAAGASIQRRAEKKARAAANAAQQDRLVTVRSAVSPRQLILGRKRVAGTLVFAGSSGQDKEELSLVIVFSGHEVDEFEQFMFGDDVVELDGAGNVMTAPYAQTRAVGKQKIVTAGSSSYVLDFPPIAGSVDAVYNGADGDVHVAAQSVSGDTATFAAPLGNAPDQWTIFYQTNVTTSYARIVKHYGTPGQVADSELVTKFPDEWSSAHRLRGCAYISAHFKYNVDAFPAGLPEITAVIRGLKCYDPRTGLTVWTDNPALLLRAYSLHSLGGRLPPGSVDDDDVIVAANHCDTEVDYATWAQLTVGGDQLTVGGDELLI